MKKLIQYTASLSLVSAVLTSAAHAAVSSVPAPEIDPSLLPAACALLGGTMMILRGRRKA